MLLCKICPACWRKAGLSVFEASNSASSLVSFQHTMWSVQSVAIKGVLCTVSFNQPQPNAISHLIPTNSTGIPHMFSSAASLHCSPSSVSLQRCSVRGFFKNGPFPSSKRKQCIQTDEVGKQRRGAKCLQMSQHLVATQGICILDGHVTPKTIKKEGSNMFHPSQKGAIIPIPYNKQGFLSQICFFSLPGPPRLKKTGFGCQCTSGLTWPFTSWSHAVLIQPPAITSTCDRGDMSAQCSWYNPYMGVAQNREAQKCVS